MEIRNMAEQAKGASTRLAATSTEARNRALASIATALQSNAAAIMAANQKDLAAAELEDLAAPLLKRLKFDQSKLDSVIEGVRSLISLADPLGVTQQATELDEGLELFRVSCPIGVIGVIFESRPDALVQISALCLKSGNGALLKGGSEAIRTNRALAETIQGATLEVGMPEGWIQLLETRSDVGEMLKLDDSIDLIIPRGSNEFVRYIMENSSIPVLGHADGICHVYIDADAEMAMAVNVAVDSKCQYVAVCNACETILVHQAVADTVLPALRDALKGYDVEIRGCARTRELIECLPADAQDWATEYLDYTVSIRVVNSVGDAIAHINRYGSGHTDVIVTRDAVTAASFMDLVDAGNVFWNCSSRFSDGFRYGLGAEVGVSTNKIHARGPVGLEGLLIYKWKLVGHGQTVRPYADGERRFTHRDLAGKGFAV